ncbi:MAG: ribonuclease HI [Deltaproteobacteria bacterium]|nr:ribonuclease HI [Deltaproteobacteria bacterium]
MPALFKGKKVFVLCDASGAPMLDGGRVPMKYRATDERIYLASPANVTDTHGLPLSPSGRPVRPETARRTVPAAEAPGSRRPAARPVRHRPSNGEIHVFTDGACSGNPGAAAIGVVIDDGTRTREHGEYLTDEGTNNLAELTAILRGLQAVGDLDRPTVLFTDSQYAIGVLLKGWKAKVHIPLIARIKKLMQEFRSLEVRYVPGHAGIEGNERADELARAAIAQRARD